MISTLNHTIIRALLTGLTLGALGCATTTHDATTEQPLPASAATKNWLELASTPGKTSLESIDSASWVVDLSGLLNLEHPRAREAGIEDVLEPIDIYMHVLKHPTRGTYVVDSGVSQSFEPGGDEPPVSGLVSSQMHMDQLKVKTSAAAWLKRNGPVAGVFLTHLHMDHIMGVPDFPNETPLFAGPQETTHRQAVHMLTRGTTNRMLKGKQALHTWSFSPDPMGIFEGVADVFGDGEVFALHVPGHTTGSTAFLVRTPTGPVLLTGDASHTAWGWEHCVEPGTFNGDGPQSAQSLKQLKRLEEMLPTLRVRPGHQELDNERSATNACVK